MDDLEYFWAGRFGNSWEFVRFKNVSTGNWPVITETAYVWTIGAVTAFTVLVGLIRIILRRKFNGRWDIDDGLFTFALCCSVVSSALNIYCVDYFYVEAQLNIGNVSFTNFDDLVPAIVQYLQILNGLSATEWIAIYSIKFCYLMFFNKLTARLGAIRVWWWFILFFTIPCLIVSCLIGLYLCHDFGPDILSYCTIPGMNERGGTWNQVSGSLDIITDLMIISIPVLLISKVKIDLRRKLIITTILSLSAFMIGTALIRLFPPTIHILTIDGTWYFFWVAFESSLAILMVSITSFKSIYGGTKRSQSPSGGSPKSPIFLLKNSWATASTKMGRFFVWNSKPSSGQSLNSSSSAEELSPISTEKAVAQGRYFQWESKRSTAYGVAADKDLEKGLGGGRGGGAQSNHSYRPPVPPKIMVQEQIRVDISQRSKGSKAGSELVSLPSQAYSPMSTMNPSVSPDSSRVDRFRDSRASWNIAGARY